MRVLIVEDESRISSFLERGLREAGFNPVICDNGDDGYHRARTEEWDVIVLDLMLPGRDGLSILKQLRAQRNAVPVIILTARGELDEKLEGLDLGADDYLTKPFFIEELIARIHAVARRLTRDQLSVLAIADLRVNLLTREVTRGDREIDLTTREFGLLEYLARSPGRVLSRTQILEHVWGYDFDPGTNVVDVYVRRLRKKLVDDGTLIQTVRGVGYRMADRA
jgi:two-component system OmpR family response regulator